MDYTSMFINVKELGSLENLSDWEIGSKFVAPCTPYTPKINGGANTYKVRIILNGEVNANSEEEAKQIYAEKMGDEMFCTFLSSEVEIIKGE